MADEEEEQDIPLGRPTRWGLLVIPLSLAARMTEDMAQALSEVAKFWCELAMAAAGQSNHEVEQRRFREEAARSIETLTSGAFDAASGEASGN